MIRPLFALALTAVCLAFAVSAPVEPMDRKTLEPLDALIRKTIHEGDAAGIVCLIGRDDRIVYRKAFGYAQMEPAKRLMSVDTVFDMASLTKVVATTTSVMKLVEEGKLTLDTRVSEVWKDYGTNGKERITIRQLLTHTGGLAPGHNYFATYSEQNKASWPGAANWNDKYGAVMADLAKTRIQYRPDSAQVYSDDGFMTLGEVVRRVSGKPLNEFVRDNVFVPLAMKDTGFLPGPEQKKRSAATERRYGRWLVGEVHDPQAWIAGGVAGHAGLFSTADDLARFCRMLLNEGSLDGVRVLGPATVRAITNPATPEGLQVRGLGWEINTRWAHRGDLFAAGSFGHTGWTGTSVWVDKPTKTYVIVLGNRTHPDGRGSLNDIQNLAATLAASAINDIPAYATTAEYAPYPNNRAEDAPIAARAAEYANVLNGIDVLEAEKFAALKGRKIGLITNSTGINRARKSTVDIFFDQHKAKTFTLAALFGPEHGIRGDKDELIKDEVDTATGLPVYSLYDYTRRIFKPTPAMLKDVDTIVFDVQDIGVRYYTYITTLAYAMEAAKENGIKIVVLDRPNPINGVTVDGPNLDITLRHFAGYYPIPLRHGMTVGELARLFNTEFKIGADLEVIACKGWRRAMWFDQTGLPWVNPSPNIRNLTEATLYAGIGVLEATTLSVGRGTDRPFAVFGAPYINDVALSEELNRRELPGLSFVPVRFTPVSREHRGTECNGVAVQLLDRDAFQGTRTAVEIMDVLRRMYGNDLVKVQGTKGMYGRKEIPDAIIAGEPVEKIVAIWQEDVAGFRRTRAKYLLYD